jgi:hypothetical protein
MEGKRLAVGGWRLVENSNPLIPFSTAPAPVASGPVCFADSADTRYSIPVSVPTAIRYPLTTSVLLHG